MITSLHALKHRPYFAVPGTLSEPTLASSRLHQWSEALSRSRVAIFRGRRRCQPWEATDRTELSALQIAKNPFLLRLSELLIDSWTLSASLYGDGTVIVAARPRYMPAAPERWWRRALEKALEIPKEPPSFAAQHKADAAWAELGSYSYEDIYLLPARDDPTESHLPQAEADRLFSNCPRPTRGVDWFGDYAAMEVFHG